MINRLGSPTTDFEVELLRDQHSAQIFTFESLGSGQTIINFTTRDMLGQPSWDPKLALYDDSGNLVPIATNDSALSLDGFDRAEIVANLRGGETYYVIVDAFDGVFLNVTEDPRDVAAGERFFQFVIESNATIDTSDPDQRIDDHIDIVTDDEGNITNQDLIRQLATRSSGAGRTRRRAGVSRSLTTSIRMATASVMSTDSPASLARCRDTSALDFRTR